MNACTTRNDCEACPGVIICHCLQVTEETVLTALETLNLRTITELRQHTGAGDGCTACHRRLQVLCAATTVISVLQAA